uniref:PAP-associated domain-containing protein n=1 Tax=Hucho hucho TaxID=62062 RepID=A0A4W5JNY8_9TELE
MLRLYSLEFNAAECVISVRTSLVLSLEDKDWPKKRIAVEDPFAVKSNVARSLNSQKMYEYVLHCLKSTYKYFALPLGLPSANHKTAEPRGANHKPGPGQKAQSDIGLVQSGLSGLILESQAANKEKVGIDVQQDSDCTEEEEEEVKSPSESDQEKEKEDLGKNSLSEEEDEVDPRTHLDSVTTEDEDLFPLDEVSGEELLSDEEGPDLDTPGSLDEEDEVAPPTVPEDLPKQASPDNRTEGTSVLCYGFTRQAFTRGRVDMTT